MNIAEESPSKQSITPHPSTCIAMVVRGWIDAVGPALTKKAVPEVKDRVMLILRQEGFAGFPEREFRNLASLLESDGLNSPRPRLRVSILGLKISGSQGLVSRSKVSRSQGLKVSRSQGLKVSRSQGLKVSMSQCLNF